MVPLEHDNEHSKHNILFEIKATIDMLTQSDVQAMAQEIGLGQTKILLDDALKNLIEQWPVSGRIHPDYNEVYRLREVLMGIKGAFQVRQRIGVAELLSAETENYVRIELQLSKTEGVVRVKRVDYD